MDDDLCQSQPKFHPQCAPRPAPHAHGTFVFTCMHDLINSCIMLKFIDVIHAHSSVLCVCVRSASNQQYFHCIIVIFMISDLQNQLISDLVI